MSTPATDIAVLAAAIAGAVVTYRVALSAADRLRHLGNPRITAACVAAITFLAMRSVGAIVLLPFAVLGTACLLVCLLRLLARLGLPSWDDINKQLERFQKKAGKTWAKWRSFVAHKGHRK